MGDQWDDRDLADDTIIVKVNSNRDGVRLMADYSDAYRDNSYPVKVDSNISISTRPMTKSGISGDLTLLSGTIAKTEDAIAGLRADLDVVLRSPQEVPALDENAISLASTDRSDVSKNIADLVERVNWILKKIDYIRANIDL